MRAHCIGYETQGKRGGVHTQPKSWRTSTAVKYSVDGKDAKVVVKGDDNYITHGTSHVRIPTLRMSIEHAGASKTKDVDFAFDATNPDDIKLLMVVDSSSHEFSTRYAEVMTTPVAAVDTREEGDDGYGNQPASFDNSPKGKAQALVDEIWNGWGFCDPQIAELRELLSKI